MNHHDFTTFPLAGIGASVRRIALATLGVIAAAGALIGVAYAVGRWL